MLQENFEEYLLENHKDVYAMVQKILHIKNMSHNTTSQTKWYSISWKENIISQKN